MDLMATLRRISPRIKTFIVKFGFFLLFSVAAVVLAAKFVVPYVISIASGYSFRGFLVPPYLFITVHVIIIAIWKLDQQLHKDRVIEEVEEEDKPTKLKDETTLKPEIWPQISTPTTVSESEVETCESEPTSCITTESDSKSSVSSKLEMKRSIEVEEEEEEEEDLVDASMENEDLDLEDTWKVISLQKSNTWEKSHTVKTDDGLKKSATFNKESSSVSGIGHDEWNRRFEAFIKKNYEQIRLQSEESYRRHVEIASGAPY